MKTENGHQKAPRGELFSYLTSLPFFSEVRQAEAHGGLIFFAAADAGDDEDDDGDHIWCHLVYLVYRKVRAGGDVDIEDVQAAEDYRGEDAQARTPHGEDDESNCKPASVAEGVFDQTPQA